MIVWLHSLISVWSNRWLFINQIKSTELKSWKREKIESFLFVVLIEISIEMIEMEIQNVDVDLVLKLKPIEN